MHTIIVSDQHLADAAVVDPKRPLWKAFKQRQHFMDADFCRLLCHVEETAREPVELVLNGDTFDFDSITRLPEDGQQPVDWLARRRGLGSEEWMSLFKLDCIIEDHPEWFTGLGEFLRRGNRVVIIIGNHDVELTWPKVQERLRLALGFERRQGGAVFIGESAPEAAKPPDERPEALVFCDWFYVSGADTYISHGHQYDPFCVAKSAIDPLIERDGRPRVRIPFGDLAERYMLNGMGYFNPNATENYIMSGREYARFYLRHMVLTQPLLLWTWFWGATVTLVIALRDFWLPAMRDPLLVDGKVAEIARRSQVSASAVRKLHVASVPSACRHPFTIVRELWLDRGLLLVIIVYVAWQIVLMVNFVWPISPLWVFVPLAILLFPYLVYSLSVTPGTGRSPLLTPSLAELIATVTGASRIVFGHTHQPTRTRIGGIDYLNCGFWSPAFADPGCTRRIGAATFVWLQPDSGTTGGRRATLFEWPEGAAEPLACRPPSSSPPTSEGR
ncbi:MAG: hypothetical protein HYV63_12410 [Candidatus Schekmanbacteria bacterium]|nr:hypothetical protein [Candidatus Schekmanbacteria bacterium]